MGTKHTNTFIPKVLAEARNYELTGDKDSKALSDFFWHTMIDHHTFAPGCSSQKEHYFDTKRFSHFLNGYTGETCCTYNMLKLSRHLFCWQPDARIADYYERALYNHIWDSKIRRPAWFVTFCLCCRGRIKYIAQRKTLLVLCRKRVREPCQVWGGHLLPQCSGHLYKSVYPFRCPVERKRDNFETGNGFPRRGSNRTDS